MAIYIKGMEMPKDCDSCAIRNIIRCVLWKPMNVGEIHPCCPLTEVPEPNCAHSRLSAEAEPSLKAIKRQIDEHWYLDPPSAEAEWIPCSERLPKHGDDILVTYSDGEVSIIRGARSKNWMKWEALENSNLILPIAWMPLPMPYREGGESE